MQDAIELNESELRKHYASFTDSQKRFADAVVSWCKNPRKTLVVLSGGPGTGKTRVVKTVFDHVRAEQLKMSFTAKSARALGGKTIHSAMRIDFRGLCHELEERLAEVNDVETLIRESAEMLDEFQYDGRPQVVLLDEAPMVSGWLTAWLFRFLFERTEEPVLFVAIGDRHQVPPVRCLFSLFSLPLEQIMPTVVVLRIELIENKRFAPDYGEMIAALREFMDREDEAGFFAFLEKHFPVVEDVDGELLSRADRAMAARNERVNTFNAYYLKNMVGGPVVRLEGNLILKPGCIVSVTKNGCSSAANGTELQFVRFHRNRLVCRDPETGKEVAVKRDPECKRFPVSLAFAATIHKFQGNTIDEAKIVIHLDGNRNVNMIYTAVSRVRHMSQILGIII